MIYICGEALFDVFAGEVSDHGIAMQACVGGSPLNVAVGVARLGSQVGLLTGISMDWLGDALVRHLQKENVDISYSPRLNRPTTVSFVGVGTDGVPSYAFYGAGAADRSLTDADMPKSLSDVRAIHFGSFSAIVDSSASAYEGLLRRMEGVLVSYDPNVRTEVEPFIARWRERMSLMSRSAHLIKISEEDFNLLYPGIEPGEKVKQWLERGVGLVVMTRGGDGACAWAVGGHYTELAARPVDLVDTVGAGDAFQSGLLSWLDKKNMLAPASFATLTAEQTGEMLAYATDASAVVCARRGADMAYASEVSQVSA